MRLPIRTHEIAPRLKTIESLAVIDRVASTNLVARRIVNECIENELSLPQAMIIANEQFAGRGRNERSWSSPAGKGIYATTLLTKPVGELALIPLEMANIVASYLREVFGIEARIKWPNDILVGGKKIAGILTEARMNEDRAYLLIGVGVNVEPVDDEGRPNSTTIRDVSPRDFGGLEPAMLAFIEHMDARLSRRLVREDVLREWRSLTIHQAGDRVHCVLPNRTVDGVWVGIDEEGRAVLNSDDGVVTVSAGDIILV